MAWPLKPCRLPSVCINGKWGFRALVKVRASRADTTEKKDAGICCRGRSNNHGFSQMTGCEFSILAFWGREYTGVVLYKTDEMALIAAIEIKKPVEIFKFGLFGDYNFLNIFQEISTWNVVISHRFENNQNKGFPDGRMLSHRFQPEQRFPWWPRELNNSTGLKQNWLNPLKKGANLLSKLSCYLWSTVIANFKIISNTFMIKYFWTQKYSQVWHGPMGRVIDIPRVRFFHWTLTIMLNTCNWTNRIQDDYPQRQIGHELTCVE